MQQPMYDQFGRMIHTQQPMEQPLPGRDLGSIGSYLASAAVNYIGSKITGSIFNGNGAEQGQSTAVDMPTQPPKETAQSGETVIMPPTSYQGSNYFPTAQAGLGALVPAAGNLLGKYLPQIIGGGAIGLAAPVVMDALTGQPKKLRVTRKLKAQVKKAVELMGIEGTAQAMGVDVNTVLFILMKKMRNDGPYVTKAAVRKTRQTIRKLDTLCDLKDEMCPPKRPAARRRTATRSTRVTNIKN